MTTEFIDYFEWIEQEADVQDFDEWRRNRQQFIVVDESNLEAIDNASKDEAHKTS